VLCWEGVVVLVCFCPIVIGCIHMEDGVEGLVQRARVSYVCLSRETALRESLSEQEYVLCFLVVVKLKRSFIASERFVIVLITSFHLSLKIGVCLAAVDILVYSR